MAITLPQNLLEELPQELLNMICDFLRGEEQPSGITDISTLQNIRLASSMLREAATPVLFRTPAFNVSERVSLRNLLSLSLSPFAPCVAKIVLYADPSPDHRKLHPRLASALGRFRNMRYIKVDDKSSYHYVFNTVSQVRAPKPLKELVLKATFPLVQDQIAPFIGPKRALSRPDLSIPFQHADLSRLEKLELRATAYTRTINSFLSSVLSRTQQLRHLTLDRLGLHTNDHFVLPNLPELRRLEMRNFQTALSDLSSFIGPVMSTLESLAFTWATIEEDEWTTALLLLSSRCDRLVSIRFHGLQDCQHFFPRCNVSDVIDMEEDADGEIRTLPAIGSHGGIVPVSAAGKQQARAALKELVRKVVSNRQSQGLPLPSHPFLD